jgi:hypothetical protein
VVTFTDRAREALLTSLSAARRFDPEARLRLERHEGSVRAVLANEDQPDDALIDLDGAVIAIEPGIDGTIDAGDHQELRVITP